MEDVDRYTASLTDNGIYRLLIESVTDYAIFMLSPTGTVSSWNPGAQRFKGYQAHEIVGRHFSEFYAEEDRAAGLPARALHAAATTGKFETEGWRVRKDGSRFWAYVVIDAIRSPTGDLVGFAKVTRDLTERREADDLLKRSERQFRLLVNGVTDYAIYMLSPEGIVSSWNAGAQRIKGYDAEEIIGCHFSRFYTEVDRDNQEPQRALAIAEREGRYEREGVRVRKGGGTFWASVVIDAIRSPDGTLLGFAKITRNIAAQKEARDALESAREALFQAQKMDAVGQLTGGVAHDFNNLLTAVLGSLELLGKRLPNDPKMRALLDNAVAGARRGATLTQRMLAFARRQDLNIEAVGIPDLVRGMSDLLERSVGASIGIEIRFPLKLPLVQTDGNQLELALLNLVVNARDAMPGGGTIIIAAREVQGAANALHEAERMDRFVCLSVADAGEGMDPETLARATEPFFTTKGVGKGTGLGLPMVHGLAHQSGGKLLLKTEQGRGTTVELGLPVASAPAPAQTESRPLAPAAPVIVSRPQTIMAVDDDTLVLNNTVAMLAELGHTVFEAASGDRALEILNEGTRVDLVITDQIMPSMTGAQLAATIRQQWPDVLIVLATGYAEWPADVIEGLTKLAKPFGLEELARAINVAEPPKKIARQVLPFRQRE
jgi:PAS domain S-box-containing protein